MKRNHRWVLYRQASELSLIAGKLIEAAAASDRVVLKQALRDLLRAEHEICQVITQTAEPDYNYKTWDWKFYEPGETPGGTRPPPPQGSGDSSIFGRAKRERRLKAIAGYGPNDTKTPLPEIFRTAQRKAHPDAGGSAELFKEVTALGITLGLCDKKGKPVSPAS